MKILSSRMGIVCFSLLIVAGLAPNLAPNLALAADSFPTITPGELSVAYRTDDKPVSFIQDGKPAGLLVDFYNAIGAKLGLKVEFTSSDFASMLPAVRNNRYDTAAFGVLVTPERQEVVNFTTPVGYSEARLVSRTDAPLAKIDGAKGKTVAITQGSALIPMLQKIAPGVTVREFPNIAASANSLTAKQVDALFTGVETAEQLLHQHADFVTSQKVTTAVTAFPVAKTNPKLLAAMNEAMASLMKDGTYSRLWAKWSSPNSEIPEGLFTDYPGMPRPIR
jgi:polar amino acid transport system substrate-binding protein